MKIRHIVIGAGFVSLGLATLGCSSSTKATGHTDSGVTGTGGGGGAPSGTPTIKITAPIEGATIDASMSADVAVEMTITNFTLKDPARTDGSGCAKSSCGHVHLLVDDGDGKFPACNNKDKPNTPYNEAAVALTGNTVGLDYCPQINGKHTIKGELHNDDHSPVNDAAGAVITSNLIHITAKGAVDGG